MGYPNPNAGTFVLKTIHSVEHSFPGPFVPGNLYSRERINPADLSLRGPFVPWNFCSCTLDLSWRRPFVHLSSGPLTKKEQRNKQKLANTQLVTGNTAIQTLLQYVKTTWIDSRLGPTSSLSAYRSSIFGTYKQRRWGVAQPAQQSMSSGNLDLFQLAPILFKESSYVSLQASLASEAGLCRHQWKTYQCLQGRLKAVWSAYTAGQRATSALLSKCSRI